MEVYLSINVYIKIDQKLNDPYWISKSFIETGVPGWGGNVELEEVIGAIVLWLGS
jgi:hypothetical protein